MPFATTLSIPHRRRARRRPNPTRKLILAGLAYIAAVVLIGAVQIAIGGALGTPLDRGSSAASQALTVTAQF
jgi:hypothetical protein